ERLLAAVAVADGHAIGVVAAVALLDLVADHGAAHRAGHGRGGVAAPAADLVAEHAAGDAAQQRAAAGGAVRVLHDVDVHHARRVAVLRHRLVVAGGGGMARLIVGRRRAGGGSSR